MSNTQTRAQDISLSHSILKKNNRVRPIDLPDLNNNEASAHVEIQSLNQLPSNQTPVGSKNQLDTPSTKPLPFARFSFQEKDSPIVRLNGSHHKSSGDSSNSENVPRLSALFGKASGTDGIPRDEDEIYRGKEFDITFNTKRFLEFLFYHLIFFFVLGPLSFIILFPTAGVKLTKNMGFFGINTMMINQSIQFLMIMSCVFVWLFTEQGNIDYVQVILVLIAVFQRMCTIASKYGSTHSVRIKLLKSKELSYDELSQDYMLIRWTNQDDELLKQELYAALKRGTVDSRLFFCRFFENALHEKKIETIRVKKLFKSMTLLDLAEDAAELADEDSSAVNLNPIKGRLHLGFEQESERRDTLENVFLQVLIQNIWSKNSSFVSGISVAWEIIQSSKNFAIPRVIPMALLIGFCRSIIPLLYRLIVYNQPLGNTSAQAYVTVMSIILNTYFWGANLSFVFVGLSDMRKKSYLIKQLSIMLNNKNESEDSTENQKAKKSSPMINIYDPFSIKTWTIIRKIFMDYGRKYYLRINWNVSGFLVYYILLAIILILQYFGVKISSEFSNVSLISAFIFELSVMGFALLNVIIVGSSINQKFQDHKTILLTYHSVLSDMIEFDEVYFPQRQNGAAKPQSMIYVKGIEEMQNLALKAGLNPKSQRGIIAIKVYLKHLRAIFEDGVKNIEIDDTNLPIQFLGIKLSFALVGQIFVGLISLGFAILQKAVRNTY